MDERVALHKEQAISWHPLSVWLQILLLFLSDSEGFFLFLVFWLFFFLPYLLPLRSCNICISCSYSLNAWAIWNSHNIGNSQFSFLKYCDSLSAFQRHVCWGTNGALPVNPICDKDFPRCTHSMVPVLLCAWLASFWSAFVLLFHLRKDTLVTNQSSAC